MVRKKKAPKKEARKAKSGDKIAGRSRANRCVKCVRDVSSHHKVDIGRVRPAGSIEAAQNTRDGRAIRTRGGVRFRWGTIRKRELARWAFIRTEMSWHRKRKRRARQHNTRHG